MPVHRIYGEEFRRAVWKLDETAEELSRLLPAGDALLQEAERRFTADSRRREWLAARVLWHSVLGGKGKITYLPSGKPCIADGSCHISISHTKGYVAVACHPRCEVGIDIEQYGTKVLRVRERFMRDDEQTDAREELYSLLLHWSAKETLYKLLGEEAVDFRQHLRIFPFAVEPEGSFSACEYKTEAHRHFHLSYRIEQDYVLTWSSDKDSGMGG